MKVLKSKKKIPSVKNMTMKLENILSIDEYEYISKWLYFATCYIYIPECKKVNTCSHLIDFRAVLFTSAAC